MRQKEDLTKSPDQMTMGELTEVVKQLYCLKEKRREAVNNYLGKYLKNDEELDEEGRKRKQKIREDRRRAAKTYYDKNKQKIAEQRAKRYAAKKNSSSEASSTSEDSN
tara:strand:+ start:398 stop:721 length:324 start_codon:yes stop_codon:yes gene_type:complete